MDYLSNATKKVVVFVLLLLSFAPGCKQLSAQDISVSCAVISEGTATRYYKDKIAFNGLYVDLTVKNNSSQERPIRMMTCHWQQNWQTNVPGLILWLPGCDHNFDTEVPLKPGHSMVFHGFLAREDTKSQKGNFLDIYPTPLLPRKLQITDISFGFAETYDPDNWEQEMKSRAGIKVWWSVPIKLASGLYKKSDEAESTLNTYTKGE